MPKLSNPSAERYQFAVVDFRLLPGRSARNDSAYRTLTPGKWTAADSKNMQGDASIFRILFVPSRMYRALSVAHISLFAMTALCRAESAELPRPSPVDAAATILPGCRESIEPGSTGEAFAQGVCIGLLRGLYYLSSDTCIPPAVTIGTVARIVVRYVDDRPSRLHEDFRELALEALRTAWPCSGARSISSSGSVANAAASRNQQSIEAFRAKRSLR